MDSPDHYATLGLDRRCTPAQIRAAYRALAKQHHPDLNGNSAEAVARSQELNAAHETLSDPAQRRSYDRGLQERATKPSPDRARIEKNVSQDVQLRIEEFIRGATLKVEVNDPGNEEGAETSCVTIPPETAPGTRLRVPRNNGGFLQLRLRARPDFRFKVRGSDLRCDLRIDARRAANGGTETIDGAAHARVVVTIPPRVARGAVVRIAGQGLPKPRGGRGDLLVRITYRPEVRITRA